MLHSNKQKYCPVAVMMSSGSLRCSNFSLAFCSVLVNQDQLDCWVRAQLSDAERQHLPQISSRLCWEVPKGLCSHSCQSRPLWGAKETSLHVSCLSQQSLGVVLLPHRTPVQGFLPVCRLMVLSPICHLFAGVSDILLFGQFFLPVFWPGYVLTELFYPFHTSHFQIS